MQISCSILASNNRPQSIKKLNQTTVDYIHIDVMDGQFVPNTNFSIEEINNILTLTRKPLDIHLMVENPIDYISKLNNSIIHNITIHEEITQDLNPIIKFIKQKGYQVGLALNPHTPVSNIIPYLNNIDIILIMSVEPGYGNQTFQNTTINKIGELQELLKPYPNIQIQVDGGIKDHNISTLRQAGVNIAVVGSFITNYDNYEEQLSKLKANN